MADYVSYGGNFLLPAPYECKQVRGYGVAVDGDRAKMQALVNRLLNRKGGGPEYFVVLPTVLFTFMHMGVMQCAGHPELGCFSERELNITFMLAAVDGLSVRVVWFMPYLWLDCGPALLAGRDIFGFQKQMAQVTIPQWGEAAELAATAEVLHVQDGSPGEMLDVFRMRRAGGILERRSNATNAFEALDILINSVLLTTGASILPAGLPMPGIDLKNLVMAFVRQLPSRENFDVTCFRAVGEAPFSIVLRSAGLLEGNYEAVIPEHASVRLARDLGIPSDGTPARAAYHLDIDFTLGAGRDLWTEV